MNRAILPNGEILFFITILFSLLVNFEYRKLKTDTLSNKTNWLKDWHDYAAMDVALNATGLGEIGKPANLEDYRVKLYEEYGYDALLSDHISLQRSVPDTRPEECKNSTQLAQLPKASVIIIFFNERLSVLLRTVYGVLNRSPNELLDEIILVDDCSTYSELQKPLTDYISINFPTDRSKVKLIRSHKRSGLMVARMTGARAARKETEILIFMDSHFEVNYNWLPPLLEPITLNPKASTCPELDLISFKDFAYVKSDHFRGYFDWTLGYKFLGLHSHEYNTPAKNRREYVLMGAAIAIGTQFFWDLGGFDDGMVYWGGEQYELSFKIWMCGGEIITVPCSRMAHLYRDPNTKGNTNLYGNYNFLYRNLRRLIDVWMDEEHRQYVFNKLPDVRTADPGDLSDRLALRERLQCKNFSWLMENIMPDLKEKYLPIEPYSLASGHIMSALNPILCITLMNDGKVALKLCSDDNLIAANKFWTYNYRGEIRAHNDICLETDLNNGWVNSYSCHGLAGNQKWHYDREKQWIVQKEHNVCMVAGGEDDLVKLSECNDSSNLNMRWTISNINQTEMTAWENKLKY